MDSPQSLRDIQKVISYFKMNESKFETVTQKTPYKHMGATITDSILQAGLNYKTVVYPRVLQLLTKYTDYRTTCDFIILMKAIPLSELISWKNEIKLNRIISLTWFLYENKIETENDLAYWLNYNENISQLLDLKGIGLKTVDYLKMLSGNQSIAIDRHLFNFLNIIGVGLKPYTEAANILSKASEMLGINRSEFDKRIWLYMSQYKYIVKG